MKAVRLHDRGDIRLDEVAMPPAPGPGDVRVAVAFAGICGSDIHNFRTGQWITRKPSVAGHEFSGVVESVGANVTALVPGDHVVADSRVHCGACPVCLSAHPHLCPILGFVGEAIDGGFADFITLPARLVLRVDPGARLDVMALAEPLAVALHALALLDAPAGAPILIVGCGPIGALCAVAAQIMGDRPLRVSDIAIPRQRLICDLTEATAVNLQTFDQHGDATIPPVRHIIDTTGAIGVVRTLLERLTGARIALVGIGEGTLSLDPISLVERELALIGCHAFAGELASAARMLEAHPAAFASLIGTHILLENVPAAYDRIVAGRAEGIKTLIRIGGSAPSP